MGIIVSKTASKARYIVNCVRNDKISLSFSNDFWCCFGGFDFGGSFDTISISSLFLKNSSTQIPLFLICIQIRIIFFHTFLTNTVAKFSFRMFLDVCLNLIPISLVITDFLAMRTDRQYSS